MFAYKDLWESVYSQVSEETFDLPSSRIEQFVLTFVIRPHRCAKAVEWCFKVVANDGLAIE